MTDSDWEWDELDVGYDPDTGEYLYHVNSATRYNGETDALVVPTELDGVQITSVGRTGEYKEGGVYWSYTPVTLTIPEGIEWILEGAFYGSAYIGTLTLPSSLKHIEEVAFYNESDGFDGTLTIPSGVISIGNWAFYGQGFNKIVVEGQPQLGGDVFQYCHDVREIVFRSGPFAISNNFQLGGTEYSDHIDEPISVDVYSLNNWADGLLDGDAYNVTFNYLEYVPPSPPTVDYEHLTYNGHKIQVDSAIRDGDGYKIASTYPKKVDIRARPYGSKTLTIAHGLNNAPSAVSLYVVHNDNGTESYEKIEADISVTAQNITIQFVELPPGGDGLELLIRSLV